MYLCNITLLIRLRCDVTEKLHLLHPPPWEHARNWFGKSDTEYRILMQS